MALIPSFTSGRRTNIFDPFSLDIWDPFQGIFGTLTQSSGGGGRDDVAALANVRIDWRETNDAHIFKAELPGMRKEEVKVELVEDGRVLQISGEKTREKEEKDDKWHRVERTTGRFLRRFRLPENAKLDEVKATMENGVLTVVVPKTEETRSEVKAIEIAGD
ncbi:17.6 kDa class I heat shock protein 3-like protein [Drosera capensis]